jgi:exodeoxyribonuclease VII large subunit
MPPERPPITVAAYLGQINRVLAEQIGRVKGEVTSIKTYDWGITFTIKDQNEPALMDCMIWTTAYQANGVELVIGDEIIISGSPDVFLRNGRFSFKANTIEYAGEGALKLAYDKLKAKLDSEGFLSPDRKRPLPAFPKKIGVITSRHGVVLQDFNTNLKRRGYKITMVDSRVEGKDAIHELLAALSTMSKQDIEVLVIMRGGGSWESLQAFNTESVVRAIADFKTPVITGVGHDVDVTLAEMVADIGQSTPTAVAEALNEPWDGLESSLNLLVRRTVGEFEALLEAQANQISHTSQAVTNSYQRQLSVSAAGINNLSHRISAVFSEVARRVRDVNASLLKASGIMRSNISAKNQALDRLRLKLSQQFQAGLRLTENSLASNFRRSVRRQAEALRQARRSMNVLEKTVAANDPKRNMRLGYSLSFINGKLARQISDVAIGQIITTQLTDGEFTSEIKGVK